MKDSVSMDRYRAKKNHNHKMYLLLWMKDTNRRMGGGRPAHNINYCGYLKNVKYVCFVCKTYWMFDYSEWLISADILFLLAISSIIYCITVICVGPLLEKLLPLLSWMVTARCIFLLKIYLYRRNTKRYNTQKRILPFLLLSFPLAAFAFLKCFLFISLLVRLHYLIENLYTRFRSISRLNLIFDC